LSLLQGRVNVEDITRVCDAFDLGSNPSTPAKSTQNKMKIKMKKEVIKYDTSN
jgi:hypothetical protein